MGCVLILGLSKGAIGEVAGQSADEINLILIRRREVRCGLRGAEIVVDEDCHRQDYCVSFLGKTA